MLGTNLYLYSVTVPHWFLALLLSIAPAVWLRKTIVRLRRPKPGHCPTCGYDLRASKDRCPECGTPVPTAPTATAAKLAHP